jgi:hypothetical protein
MVTSKTTLFAIDAVIATAFLAAGMSAIAFLVPYSTIDFATASSAPAFLGIGYGVWRTIHQYAGIVMGVGGLTHLIIHWSWMLSVGRGLLAARKGVRIAASAKVADDV